MFFEKSIQYCLCKIQVISPQDASHFKKGFTLVEIMVAIVVLSIGFFAASSMQISAVSTNSSANHITEATNLAQSRIEELMALEYSRISTDPDLIDDAATAGGPESYNDSNGNGLRDEKEPYTDSNSNGVWDAAHVDPNPPSGYTITWSVLDNTTGSPEKYLRVYVTRHDNKRTIMLSCIKTRE
jgi:prepilin-type N-terminal cleavage/methylation domain-containing protein